MSATHILTSGGQVNCGRNNVRGYITEKEYQTLLNAGQLRTQMKTNIKHSCNRRPCGCARRVMEQSMMCKDCVR